MPALDPGPLETACRWMKAGQGVALATVIKTWGSAPRPVGSHLVIRDDGQFEGSVSGGCVEGEVIVEAQSALKDLQPKRLEFGVSNSRAWEVGLACGGTIEILVQPLLRERHLRLLNTIIGRYRSRQSSILLIDMETGEADLYDAKSEAKTDLADQINTSRRSDKSRIATTGQNDVFIQIITPPVHLLLIGAVHISQALLPMLNALGWNVTVIDPRGAFANRERFPHARLIEEWPDEVLEQSPPDERTAVVTLTHDPKLDDAALVRALESPAFYIGSLGSKKTHAARLERLEKRGISKTDLCRIHGPVGLSIGAASPAEIAVAIIAEIIQCLRRNPR